MVSCMGLLFFTITDTKLRNLYNKITTTIFQGQGTSTFYQLFFSLNAQNVATIEEHTSSFDKTTMGFAFV